MALPATDDFNRANGLLGTGNWTVQSGLDNIVINTNAIRVEDVGFDAGCNWNADTPGNDQFAEIRVITLNTNNAKYCGATVRAAAAAQSFYAAGALGPLGASATLEIRKCVAGTTTIISSATKTIVTTDVIRCQVVSQTITAFVNGVSQLTGAGGGSLTVGRGGVFMFVDSGTQGDAVADDFKVDTVASAVTSSPGAGALSLAGQPLRLGFAILIPTDTV